MCDSLYTHISEIHSVRMFPKLGDSVTLFHFPNTFATALLPARINRFW